MAEATEVASEHAGDEEEEHAHESRWPLPAAIGAGALYLGAGFYFVGQNLVPSIIPIVLVAVGTLGLLGGLAGWANEAFIADYRSSHGGESGVLRMGMILFLASDVSTFSAGFAYYAFIRVGAWPPEHLPSLLGSLVVVNTALLVASSFTLHYAHEALESGNRRRFLGLMGATLLLGVVFLGGQIYEYYELLVAEGFTLSTGILGSAFFGLTGLHGLHVALGVLLLAIAFGRALKGHYSAERDTAIQTTSLYWHFVDVVWIFLVLVLYVGASI
ncbi:cytochrome c oxidase subunit 3 [Haloarcula nitratireducens]|uniref:Heme-copper oxidase subunit III n=1 Tax=Haloarcula nitratireducens TaxID=2487749 RepID=A0AAW4P9Y4_9EURY|nr:heme-copper oxidase subunit III [Halomicroarcula nitratireducens]MBX0294305.1 heme-copper oxidase subunit III [Halomicroarcula nitratireducens]